MARIVALVILGLGLLNAAGICLAFSTASAPAHACCPKSADPDHCARQGCAASFVVPVANEPPVPVAAGISVFPELAALSHTWIEAPLPVPAHGYLDLHQLRL